MTGFANYYFIPSLRQGLAAAVHGPATGERAQLGVTLHLTADGGDLPSISKPVQLYGPGDVVGFDSRIVTRTDPRADVGDFEPNYFPVIEFADPDFLWRFTADVGDSRGLKPWITLIALLAEDVPDDTPSNGIKQKEFEEGDRGGSGQAPWIRVKDTNNLPDLDLAEAWRWAHVQVTADENAADLEAELRQILISEPERAVSRLVCPRRLRPGTLYRALVVPTFELGRCAALGKAPPANANALTPAWTAGQTDLQLPYYYEWEFRTGMGGDFEHLVRLLQPRKLTDLGVRPMDCGSPGYGMPSVERIDVGAPHEHDLDLEGALRSLDTGFSPWGQDAVIRAVAVTSTRTSATVTWTTVDPATARVDYGETDGYGSSEEASALSTSHSITLSGLTQDTTYHYRISSVDVEGNSAETADATFVATDAVPAPGPNSRFQERLATDLLNQPLTDLPSVVPPIYGRWHAGRPTVDETGASNMWIDHLNLDPRHRAAAGFGALVVKQQQESLMASAWQQLGAVEEANELLRRAQLGREASDGIFQRLGTLPLGDFLRVVAPVAGRVRTETTAGEVATVHQQLRDSPIPAAALDPAFRRVARPRGPVRRRQRPEAAPARPDVLERLNTGDVVAAPEHPRPDGMLGLCDITQAFNSRDESPPADPPIDVPAPGRPVDGTPRTTEVTGGAFDAPGGSAPSGDAVDLTGEPPGDPSILEPLAEPVSIFPATPVQFCEEDVDCGVIQSDPQVLSGITLPSGVTADLIRSALCDAVDQWLNDVPEAPAPPAQANLTEIQTTLREALDPRVTIENRTLNRIRLQDVGRPGDPLGRIVAAPEFPQPMYEPLRDTSQELLLAGIEHVPQNTLGLLKTNRRFVESYMVGLNHEFASELLWREYPTDQRGSYFRQFWDVSEYVPSAFELTQLRTRVQGRVPADAPDRDRRIDLEVQKELEEELKDVAKLNQWGTTPLGENDNRKAHGREDSLVLIIRGDLLKKYPNTVIYAIDARDNGNGGPVPGLSEFLDGGAEAVREFPVFSGTLGADITFLGFPFVDGEGKFFVLEERVSEARFGMDAPGIGGSPPLETWNDLSWDHMSLNEGDYVNAQTPTPAIPTEDDQGRVWGDSSATNASITLQKPVRIAVHASQMVPAGPSV